MRRAVRTPFAQFAENRGDKGLINLFESEAVLVDTFSSLRSARTAPSWALSPRSTDAHSKSTGFGIDAAQAKSPAA
jgi:hypothetical protein